MAKTLSVLIVEDDEDDTRLLVRHLGNSGFHVRHQRVETVVDLQAALSSSQWDLVLCDYNVPGFDAPTALRNLDVAGIDIPFIAVSGAVTEEKLVELMKAGAHDIILKDNLTRLAPAIERELVEAKNRRERHYAETRLREAIESIPEGFAIYDANNQLVLCNEIYRSIHERNKALFVPSRRFEESVQQGALLDKLTEAEERVEDPTAERVAQRRDCDRPVERQLPDGRWLRLSEQRMSDGGHVSITSDITDLKERETLLAELARKNEVLAAAILSTSNGILITDPNKPDNPIIFTNPAFTTLTGYTADEAIGRNCRFLQGTETDDATVEVIRLAIEQHRPVTAEILSYRKDGTSFWLELTISPIFGVGGQLDYFVGIQTDITARKQTEQALRESRERFSSLVANIAGAVYRGACDEHWTMAFMSDAIKDISGYPASDFENNNVRSFASLIVEEDQAMVKKAVVNAVERREPFTVRYRILDADGRIRWVWDRGVGVFDAQGQLLWLDGAIFDITDQQHAEEALRASERQLGAILDNAMEAVVSIDEAGLIQAFNSGAETVFGYRAEEVISRPLDILIPPSSKAVHASRVADSLRSDGNSRHLGHRRLINGLRKDGSEFPAEVSISKLRLDGQTVITAMLHDVSDRVAAEARLRQAQKMEALGQLTGGIAHDFNNLLTVILGNARLLERSLADEQRLIAKAGAITNAAKRGAGLVARLLAFSRKESLEPKVIDGRELVSGMVDMLRRTLGETIEIKTEFVEESLDLFADPNQMEASLLNLATNARDVMPNGGELTIAMENFHVSQRTEIPGAQLVPGDYVILSVSDSGTGISADQLERIFEPFFTTKEVGKGTGLGLSMVFGFVQQSGGQILVESELGQGTTFRLYLPKAEAPTRQPSGTVESERRRDVSELSETILVVEDEPEVRKIAVSILEDLGYRVIEAESGPDALAKLEAQPRIDLLFTDMIMPGGMSGYELAEKAKDRWSNLKVLYTSGYTDDALAGAGGDVRLLRKPYEDVLLATEVKEALAQRS